MSVRMLAFAALSVPLLAGCATSGGEDGEGGAGWPTGIVYRDPTTGRLASVGPAGRAAELGSGGFDLVGGVLAQGDNQDRIQLVLDDSSRGTITVQGAHRVARVSLDPEARFAVVQGTQGEGPPDPLTNDLDVHRVDLMTGVATAIGPTPVNEESPEWSPDGSRIAYSSFSPVTGVDLHIVDAVTLQETQVIEDAGGLHLSFNRDGSLLLEAGSLRIYDAATGGLKHDLRDEALAGLAAAGHEVEDRFPGQADRGTFPLDGDFSPDGTRLVFDGAVKQGEGSAIVIATMGLDGSGFTIVAGPFPVDPAQTNGLNYSETNPMWR